MYSGDGYVLMMMMIMMMMTYFFRRQIEFADAKHDATILIAHEQQQQSISRAPISAAIREHNRKQSVVLAEEWFQVEIDVCVSLCVFVWGWVCVRARACVRACAGACVRACVCVCV